MTIEFTARFDRRPIRPALSTLTGCPTVHFFIVTLERHAHFTARVFAANARRTQCTATRAMFTLAQPRCAHTARAPRAVLTTSRARRLDARSIRPPLARRVAARAMPEDAREMDGKRRADVSAKSVSGEADAVSAEGGNILAARAEALALTALEWGRAAWPTFTLVASFGGWYYFSIAFNIYQKALLKAVPMPWTVTALELLIGSALVAATWGVRLKRAPECTSDMIKAVGVLGTVHFLGNALTNVSLGKVAVSFTHTVKALEPVFSVGLSAAFLGAIPSLALCASLIPIIAGVMIASATEVSFNMAGFLSAMGSNLTFQSRNVLSKMFMKGDEMKKLDYYNLLGVLTIASTVIAIPVALATEFSKMTLANVTAGGMPIQTVGFNLVMAALCFQLYQQLSFSVLERVNPVTHSVGNSLKRVIVIAASVLIFRNPVSATNIGGTALAIFGVILYGQVKQREGAKKSA